MFALELAEHIESFSVSGSAGQSKGHIMQRQLHDSQHVKPGGAHAVYEWREHFFIPKDF